MCFYSRWKSRWQKKKMGNISKKKLLYWPAEFQPQNNRNSKIFVFFISLLKFQKQMQQSLSFFKVQVPTEFY